MKKTTIHIVRHGQSHGNVDPRTSGPDPGLTEEGKGQVKKRAETLAQEKFDIIYTSHLLRARETAEILKGEREVEINVFPQLEERGFGDLFDRPDVVEQLATFDKIQETLTDEQRWEYKYIPSMETEKDALRRFLSAIQTIVQVHKGKNVLVIGHGNLIRCLLVHLGKATFVELPHSSFENAGYLRLVHAREVLVLEEVIGLKKKEVL